jgi:hypothetical protein
MAAIDWAKERAAFEAWAATHNADIRRVPSFRRDGKPETQRYLDDAVAEWWYAWCARAIPTDAQS